MRAEITHKKQQIEDFNNFSYLKLTLQSTDLEHVQQSIVELEGKV